MKKLICTALVIAGAFFYTGCEKTEKDSLVLELRDFNSGRVLQSWHLKEGSEFAIEFIHSVNMSPARDSFIIEEGLIRLADGFNTSIKELNYIVGTVSDHLLFINGESFSLRDLAGINAKITIRLR
ncbi:MAG: DUF1850 domain-containing protein [Treponema sp.]|nr:DUF1850 domain-containing protein [Treponema sp.]